MSDESRNDDRRKVTSVGNSWIVCKSKSHSGHVYYFNTLTGEAAWNLSDVEIEKAKTRTKRLEHQPGAKPTRCPEPKDPPSTDLNKPQLPPRELHEPFVFSAEQKSSILAFSNSPNNDVMFHSPGNQMTGIVQYPQMNNSIIDPTYQINTLNNSISTLNLNSTSIYNPKVWAIPQMQQILMPPTIPLVNHTQASYNIANLSHTVSQAQPDSGFVSRNFENGSHSGVNRGTRNFFPRHFNYGHDGQRNTNKFVNQTDLRQKLSSKKRFCNVPSDVAGGSSMIRTLSRRTDHAASENEDVHSNGLNDDGSLVNISTETQLNESTYRIDLGPLKSLAPSDANADAWFIVVDLDVLLKEFKFLTTLIDSDEQCRLMIPKCVMTHLENYVTCTENVQARRILRFLSQQIESGYAFMAKEPHDAENNLAEAIHTTCIELSEEKYHVILLTSDGNILLHKHSSPVYIFTADEVKNLLMTNTNKQPVLKKPLIVDSLINKIKIVVPNDKLQQKVSTSADKDIQLNNHIGHSLKISTAKETIAKEPIAKEPVAKEPIANEPIAKEPTPKENDNKENSKEVVLPKRTVDAGIQTDFEDISACQNMVNVSNQEDLKANSQISKEVATKPAVVTNLNVTDKKREIKLKRSISNQPPAPTGETNRRPFKWGRRRNTTPHMDDQLPSHGNKIIIRKKVEFPQPSTLNIQPRLQKPKPGTLVNNPLYEPNKNIMHDDSIESRDSSISADQRNPQQHVTIEETSTSGIISNTESNVDAESDLSNSTTCQQQLIRKEQTYNKPLYEIDSLSMEEYLNVKSDEWISRFIQIMEEVLTQVLQQDPSFSHSALPPPWTLHEAAQCVVMKFNGHQDIKEAANRLSTVLFDVSDAKGKITMDMEPHKYMQMYSYGVHVLAAITPVANNCEDIQVAVDSLRKLLEDIRNPYTDCNTHDSFKEDERRNSQGNSLSNEISSDICNDNSLCVEESLPNCSKMQEKVYDCRSNNMKNAEKEPPKAVKFIRNVDIESSFFKSLSLQRISNLVNDSENDSNLSYEPQHQLNKKQLDTDSKREKGSNWCHTSEHIGQETAPEVLVNKQNIIRNFTICPEFEEKLKGNNNVNRYGDHDDDLDYEEDYGEYVTEDHLSESDSDDERQPSVTNAMITNVSLSNSVGLDTPHKNCTPSPKTISPVLNKEHTKQFKFVMYKLLKEIKMALSQVKVLCDQCFEELKNSKGNLKQRLALKEKAERAHLHIVRLCRSLESMLDQETNNPNQNIYSLLKKADINIRYVDPSLLIEYKNTVSNCKEHANTFLCAIQHIISVFNN